MGNATTLEAQVSGLKQEVEIWVGLAVVEMSFFKGHLSSGLQLVLASSPSWWLANLNDSATSAHLQVCQSVSALHAPWQHTGIAVCLNVKPPEGGRDKGDCLSCVQDEIDLVGVRIGRPSIYVALGESLSMLAWRLRGHFICSDAGLV